MHCTTHSTKMSRNLVGSITNRCVGKWAHIYPLIFGEDQWPDLRDGWNHAKEFCPKLVSRQVQLNHFILGGKFNQLACSVTNLPLNIIQAWEGQLFDLLHQLTQFVSRIFYSKKRLAKNLRIFCFQKTIVIV